MATAAWRLPQNYSDWVVHLGGQVYHVHRVHLATGRRGSEFFRGCFNADFQATSSTDLSAVLPEACRGAAFESVLDYLYGCDVQITAASVVHLLKIADVLQIPALVQTARAELPSLLTPEAAPRVLASAHGLQESDGEQDGMAEVRRAAYAAILSHFWEVPADSAAELPTATLARLLGEEELEAEEAQVFDVVVTHLARAQPEVAEARELWRQCRFALLPASRLPEALRQAPSDLLAAGLAARVLAREGGPRERAACPLPEERGVQARSAAAWPRRRLQLPLGHGLEDVHLVPDGSVLVTVDALEVHGSTFGVVLPQNAVVGDLLRVVGERLGSQSFPLVVRRGNGSGAPDVPVGERVTSLPRGKVSSSAYPPPIERRYQACIGVHRADSVACPVCSSQMTLSCWRLLDPDSESDTGVYYVRGGDGSRTMVYARGNLCNYAGKVVYLAHGRAQCGQCWRTELTSGGLEVPWV